MNPFEDDSVIEEESTLSTQERLFTYGSLQELLNLSNVPEEVEAPLRHLIYMAETYNIRCYRKMALIYLHERIGHDGKGMEAVVEVEIGRRLKKALEDLPEPLPN